jgi:hypothetical protein
MLSCRLKGKWSLRRRQGFHSTSLSKIGIIFSLIFTYTNGGESKKVSQKSPFLAINAKEGEILSPKQKDRTTTNLKNFQLIYFGYVYFQELFQNWYLNEFDLIWYLQKLVKPS